MSARIRKHSSRTSSVKSTLCFWRTSLRTTQRSHVSGRTSKDELHRSWVGKYLNCSTHESFAFTKDLLFCLFCLMISFWKLLKLRREEEAQFQLCTRAPSSLKEPKDLTCSWSLSLWP